MVFLDWIRRRFQVPLYYSETEPKKRKNKSKGVLDNEVGILEQGAIQEIKVFVFVIEGDFKEKQRYHEGQPKRVYVFVVA